MSGNRRQSVDEIPVALATDESPADGEELPLRSTARNDRWPSSIKFIIAQEGCERYGRFSPAVYRERTPELSAAFCVRFRRPVLSDPKRSKLLSLLFENSLNFFLTFCSSENFLCCSNFLLLFPSFIDSATMVCTTLNELVPDSPDPPFVQASKRFC